MEHRRLVETLAQVAEKFGIRMALLFGSAVSGKTHQKSDLDVAVLLRSQHVTTAGFAELHHELQQAVPGSELDLSLLNRADPLFLKKITDSCVLLFGDERDLQKLRIYSFRRFQDHKRFLALESEYVKRIIRRAGGRP